MNFFVQRSELRDLYDKVAAGERVAPGTMPLALIVALLHGLAAALLWSCCRKTVSSLKSRGRRTGTNSLMAGLIVALVAGCSGSETTESSVNSRLLPNGLRVVVVHFPGSTNESVFSFLPMGLASDAPNQAQWSHLVEHLVIRSTVPANSPHANAETLPDHMRLDFYGHTGNWLEAISHHRRWLEGLPFTEASLEAEKPRVNQECDFTARNFATHKFAAAAWSQGVRHGGTNVFLKGDVSRAGLADIQRLRAERLVVSNRVTLCLVGGVAMETAFAEVEKQFGGLNLPLPPPVSPATSNSGKLYMTWDLAARHLLLTWPIPGFRQERHAELLVAAQCLNIQLAADTDLARQVGMVFAGADLASSEGNFFFVSASLRPTAQAAEVRGIILSRISQLGADAAQLSQAAILGRQLSGSLTSVPKPQSVKARAPAGVSLAMIEGNLGLQVGMHAHRYGDRRLTVAKELGEISADQVRAAVREYLSEPKATECTLRPPAP